MSSRWRVMVNYGERWVPAWRTDDGKFFDPRGLAIVAPDGTGNWRRPTEAEVAVYFRPLERIDLPAPDLAVLTALIERGLEKWPDGLTARCVMNGETYQTYALGYVLNGTASDAGVMAEMARLFDELKAERKAKFISWRKPLEWYDRPLKPSDMIANDCNEDRYLTCINDHPRRYLRCRVLITAKTNDRDWASKPLEDE